MLHLVVDNTSRIAYVGSLLRAIHMATAGEPLPRDMVDLLLSIDMETIEDDLRLGIAQAK